MAGQGFERQENGLVKIINRAYEENMENSFTFIDVNGVKITKVIGARKYSGRAKSGNEPYTDVEILRDVPIKSRYDGQGKPVISNIVNLSNKGESAPSVAGGGLSGLESIVEGIGVKLFGACATYLTQTGHRTGSRGTDLFIEVDVALKEPIIVGNENMGGPIDYMYVGPMSVIGILGTTDKKGFPGWNPKKEELKVNGTLTKAADYANKYDIFYRVRKRRVYQVVNTTKKNPDGTNRIFVTPDDIALDKKTGRPSTSRNYSTVKYNSKKYIGFFGPPISNSAKDVASRGQDPGFYHWNKKQGKREDNRRLVIAKAKPSGLRTGKKINGFIIYGSEK